MKKVKHILFLSILSFPFLGISQNSINLVTPYNKDTIETKFPVFTWNYLQPSFQQRDKNVEYIFTLAELNDNQSAQAGLLVNSPLLHIEGIQGFQFPYPMNAPNLQYNHRYGWQIQKEVNGIITNESEAWEFILYKEIVVPQKYAVLNTTFGSNTYTVKNKGFFFKFEKPYHSDTGLKFQLLNDKMEQISITWKDDKKMGLNQDLVKTGNEFYYLKTANLPTGIYTLIITDIKGNQYNTKFEVQ